MDLCFISIKSHGISPEYEENDDVLNMFGLFDKYEYAINYLEKNINYIPEHKWKIVGIYTNVSAFNILNALIKKVISIC